MVRYEGLGLDNVWLVNGYERIETGYGSAWSSTTWKTLNARWPAAWRSRASR